MTVLKMRDVFILANGLAIKASFRRATTLGRSLFSRSSTRACWPWLSRLLMLLTPQLNRLSHRIRIWFKTGNDFLRQLLFDELLNIPEHLMFVNADQRYRYAI